MNKIYIIIAILILIIGAVFVLGMGDEPDLTEEVNVENTNESGVNSNTPSPNTNNNTPTPSGAAVTKTFDVIAKNFSFSPSIIAVNKGDIVRINFINENGSHDFVLNDFNAKTQVTNTGQTQTIEFIADKTGSFEYYCSVGSHRTMGMRGTLVVQ
jgi:plastocyanin